MVTSILNDTKQALGMSPDDTSFDAELMMHINSVMAVLNQLGVGPEAGYAIVNELNTWDQLLGDDLRLNQVQSYVYLKVRMLFDPPSVGYVLTSMEKMIQEAEWRIQVAKSDPLITLTSPEVVVPYDPFE